MARREFTAAALTEAFLARIDALDHKIASFVTLTADLARAAAKQADMEMGQGFHRGPLHGIPIGLKDIYETAGVRTTGHSPENMVEKPITRVSAGIRSTTSSKVKPWHR